MALPGAGWLYPPTLVPGIDALDPFTPLLRAYQGDNVQIRTLPGAHTQGHVGQVHGVRWYMEPTYANSGSRNAQPMGISQHFEWIFRVPPATDAPGKSFADFFYAPSSDIVGLNNGQVEYGFGLGQGTQATWVNVSGGNTILPNRFVQGVTRLGTRTSIVGLLSPGSITDSVRSGKHDVTRGKGTPGSPPQYWQAVPERVPAAGLGRV